MTRSRILIGAVVGVAMAAAPALAHFHLDAPAAITTQSQLGDPQKTAPCGPSDIASVASGDITEVMTGSMVTVTISETILHPGHYRIALATDVAGLPDDPPVMQVGNDPCGSTTVETNPTLPILADGVFDHISAFTEPQSVQVQLPAGMQCDNCVLQVIQYMRSHSAPCFYHHCAALKITDNPMPPGDDAGVTPGDDAGTMPGGDSTGGCCSSSGTTPSGAIALGMIVFGALFVRRRR